MPSVIAQVNSIIPITVSVAAQGVPGVGGVSQFISYIAGENLLGHSAVKIVNRLVYHVSSEVAGDLGLVVGITTANVSQDAMATVQFTGVMTHSLWSWSSGRVLVGIDGALTQNITGSFVQSVGVAIDVDAILINPQHSIVHT